MVLGVAVVGLAGVLFKHPDADGHVGNDTLMQVANNADDSVVRGVVGVLLIAGAQIFTATQFVLEEYILEKFAMEPVKVVGWEGIFGFSVTVIGMIVGHFAYGRTPAGQYGYFDAAEGLREWAKKEVFISSILIMISIGFVLPSIFYNVLFRPHL